MASQKLVVVMHTCILSAQVVEAGGSEVQSHPQLHSEFEVSLPYMRSQVRVLFQRLSGIIINVVF